MNAVSGAGTSRHFSAEEEESLRRDESTNAVVKRDAKTAVDIYGTDRSWEATKHHQQGVSDNKVGAFEIGHAAFEGAEIAGLVHAGAAGAIGGPIAGMFLGLYALGEAQKKGDEQARALAKDNAHVALIGVLDLPTGYKQARLDGDYKHVAKGDQSPATKMLEGLRKDPKGVATLQLHADRGMSAGRDLTRSGLSVQAYLNANPKVAENYKKDAAFREGFDAHLYAKAHLPQADVNAMENKLAERDGWYAQSQISLRG